jgi:hypothetical protein
MTSRSTFLRLVGESTSTPLSGWSGLSSTARFGLLWVGLAGTALAAEEAQPIPPEQLAFFEQKIRPVLVEQCYSCHSTEAQQKGKLKGGLFLDNRAALLKGGDTGPAIAPDKPNESILLTAIRWEDRDIEMPPKKKLPPEVIADFEKWLAMGAPDPRGGAVGNAKREINLEDGRKHWAFQPLQNPAPPAVRSTGWAQTAVDHFILAKQEAAGVAPANPASREKLIRRASFGLIGLPPTPEEVDAFVADGSPEAFTRVVDRLLASPHYGERWGRHWLDVVRFGESGGYEFDRFRPGAYHYRDWVIRALNADLPYDEFVRQQLAGDLLNKTEPLAGAASTGFLVAGPYPGQVTAKAIEKTRYDQLDDMISAAGGAFLGLSLGCVRCHDHKFDPIPQADYYAIAAALGKSTHTERKFFPPDPKHDQLIARHSAQRDPLNKAWSQFIEGEFEGRFADWQKNKLPGLQPGAPWQRFEVFSAEALNAWIERSKDGRVSYLRNNENNEVYTVKVRTFQKGLRGFRLDAFSDPKLPKKGPGTSGTGTFSLSDFKVVAKPLAPGLKQQAVSLKLKAVKASSEQKGQGLRPGNLSNAVDNNPNTAWTIAGDPGKDQAAVFAVEGDPVGFEGGTELTVELRFQGEGTIGKFALAFCNEGELAGLADASEPQDLRELKEASAQTPTLVPAQRETLARWFGRFDDRAGALASALLEHDRSTPRREPVRVYTVGPANTKVYLLRRGEADNKADKAAPGFLQVLSRADSAQWLSPKDPDPRLGLGRWLTDHEKGAGHLLARVIVNRVWKHHFGRGLVASSNDFGFTGEKPSHPELLDFLASELVRGGWKLKPLQRLIMASAVYQQGGSESAENRRIDVENKLLWQQTPRRLEGEVIRDALLSVSGTRKTDLFGPSIADVHTPRRSVYLQVRRSELIPFLSLFDAPDATQSVGDRGLTTVPTQSLTLMNSPFVRGLAKTLAARATTEAKSPEAALEQTFRLAFSRPPSTDERTSLGGFLRTQNRAANDPKANTEALEKICHVLLCCSEFIYVD